MMRKLLWLYNDLGHLMVLAPIRYIAILPSDVITYDGSCSSSALPVEINSVQHPTGIHWAYCMCSNCRNTTHFCATQKFWNLLDYFTLKWHGIIALFRGGGGPEHLTEKIWHCVKDFSGESLLSLFLRCRFCHVHVCRILLVASIINHFQVFVVYTMVIKISYLGPVNRSGE